MGALKKKKIGDIAKNSKHKTQTKQKTTKPRKTQTKTNKQTRKKQRKTGQKPRKPGKTEDNAQPRNQAKKQRTEGIKLETYLRPYKETEEYPGRALLIKDVKQLLIII